VIGGGTSALPAGFAPGEPALGGGGPSAPAEVSIETLTTGTGGLY
jgi:hypothetical protein